MKKLVLGVSIAALTVTGAAYAQNEMRPRGDSDGNGVISRDEAQASAASMFARMDVNGDGVINPDDREARRAQMFDRIDTDNDGSISRDEFEAMRGHHGMRGERGERGDRMGRKAHNRGGHAFKMMRMADANNDGAISQAEFTAAAMTRFETADANNDGQVTKEERQAARKAMREQWRERRSDRAN
ncbi:hypothetical protein GCM10011371_26510 [Novosphingobium marinum]|uniref:Ca2+-binding EF-hand superfamily protein n=1 Tax=Novosphingobium marinum TaxID=1514948 RepID=A0A7Y9XWR6_9SPHN|nr:EF-hand domain-containing protein [Novosphingobium marinum]NYH94733.1 Ca2+-binding EF-hand superfamily protein [Novosphingobium marinum]GGC37737.1 hypothetical protein GCM10011371_26510 [Novosphingobium marinum]